MQLKDINNIINIKIMERNDVINNAALSSNGDFLAQLREPCFKGLPEGCQGWDNLTWARAVVPQDGCHSRKGSSPGSPQMNLFHRWDPQHISFA